MVKVLTDSKRDWLFTQKKKKVGLAFVDLDPSVLIQTLVLVPHTSVGLGHYSFEHYFCNLLLSILNCGYGVVGPQLGLHSKPNTN